ncbi:Riboflavin kinase / FMN adenylyltransferase [uncultured Candidatus Thioglobus sp.]|nr:Riboflavin kinase / FMN adenylyltransferase [uncultured Candidatus Thioglobus sp.]
MKLIRGLHNLKKHLGSVITIGNFDGVHLGHQKIISRLTKKSQELGLPSVLISFIPTPQSFFGREQALLSNFKEKHRFLSELGVDIHLIINFNQVFSELTAQDFVQEVLLNKLNVRHCLIGDDFRFGKDRKGDFKLLEDFSKTNHFTIENTPSILQNNCRISSSEIRSRLANNELQAAATLLGREFSITGKIIDGLKNGRLIDFPTINIPIKRKISPIYGIFSVTVVLNGCTFQGVCSIGNRPIASVKYPLLEVFLFDFNAQVYGLEAKIIFKHKIRDEQAFDNFEDLKQQIKIDVQAAKKYFSSTLERL